MTAKKNDIQGRLRNKIVAFRMSPQESEVLNAKVKMSGLTKQDYLIACCNDKDIIVQGNPYVFKSLRNQLKKFIKRFEEISDLEEMELDEVILLEIMLSTIIAMKEKKKAQIKVQKESPEK